MLFSDPDAYPVSTYMSPRKFSQKSEAQVRLISLLCTSSEIIGAQGNKCGRVRCYSPLSFPWPLVSRASSDYY